MHRKTTTTLTQVEHQVMEVLYFFRGEGRVGGPPVELSERPKTLMDLWLEWTQGTGGQKPAKDFSRHERGGKVRFRYYRRKVFWDVISKHVAAGYDAQTAIERVRMSYGYSLSVYSILEKMTKDKKTGGHPNLRI
jgi:Transcriptional activator of glycolytic enzymes